MIGSSSGVASILNQGGVIDGFLLPQYNISTYYYKFKLGCKSSKWAAFSVQPTPIHHAYLGWICRGIWVHSKIPGWSMNHLAPPLAMPVGSSRCRAASGFKNWSGLIYGPSCTFCCPYARNIQNFRNFGRSHFFFQTEIWNPASKSTTYHNFQKH